jgi:diguanylate cyclase (GGDEF)-like protein
MVAAFDRRERRAGAGAGPRTRLEIQVLCLQTVLALLYCAGATLGVFGGEPLARAASVAWIGGYHIFHAFYIVAYRSRGRAITAVEIITPALDVSCIGVAWVATGYPGSALWAVYPYALVGYARRAHGMAYFALAVLVAVNLVAARVAIGLTTEHGLFDANASLMLAITACAAILSTAIGNAWRRAEGQATLLAETDPLTGIANRRKFLGWLDALAERRGTQFSILMLDLDDFKLLNDRHGHLYGDDVLVQVARILEEHVDERHRVARYGGEEFVVGMPGTSLAVAREYAELLRDAVCRRTPTTVSIGCAARVGEEGASGVMGRADDQLLIAKRTGKNSVRADAGLRRVA